VLTYPYSMNMYVAFQICKCSYVLNLGFSYLYLQAR